MFQQRPITKVVSSAAKAVLAAFLLVLPDADDCNGAELTRLTPDCAIRFATRAEATQAITQLDDFTRELSRFDLESRLGKSGNVTREDWTKFVAEQTRDWSAADEKRVTEIAQAVGASLSRFKLPLPKEIVLALTTGKEEANAAYCRGNTIVLPESLVAQGREQIEPIFAHEVFHVLSNQNPDLRRKLYKLVGFETCEEIKIHPSLEDRRITNPDAPRIDCVMQLRDAEQAFAVAPVLYATSDYDVATKKSFFAYLTFRLMVVEKKQGRWVASEKDGRAVVIDPKKSKNFREQIGDNTNYIIHPEEIMADNFMHLVMGRKNLPSPQIVEGLRRVLAE